jgi:hypothetical protein
MGEFLGKKLAASLLGCTGRSWSRGERRYLSDGSATTSTTV